jgi:PAS domain S-box-containing protein
MASKAGASQEHSFSRQLRRWLVLGNLLIAALFVGLVVKWQAGILQGEQENERRQVLALASSISQAIAGQMDQTDLGMQSIILQLQTLQSQAGPPRPQQVNAMLAAQLRIMPALESLVLSDAQGRLRYADHTTALVEQDLQDSSYFQQARAQTQPALIFSEMLLPQGTQGQRLFAVRRLQHADGSFAGILRAAINPAHFQRLFSAMELGANASVSLRNDARQILARVADGKGQERVYGNAETSPELAKAFDSGAASGSFLSTARQDGIERLAAFQRVAGYPFMVIVGQGTDSYLLPWRAQVARIALLCGLAIVIMAALSVLFYFAIQRETGGRRQLEEALLRNQALLQASQDGVHTVAPDGTIVSASPALARLLGYHPDYLQGHCLSLLTTLPLHDLTRVQPGPDGVRKLLTQYRKLDGSLLDVELYVSTVDFSTGPLLLCSARDVTFFLPTTRNQYGHTV